MIFDSSLWMKLKTKSEKRKTIIQNSKFFRKFGEPRHCERKRSNLDWIARDKLHNLNRRLPRRPEGFQELLQ